MVHVADTSLKKDIQELDIIKRQKKIIIKTKQLILTNVFGVEEKDI
jgi:hypothetical protein